MNDVLKSALAAVDSAINEPPLPLSYRPTALAAKAAAETIDDVLQSRKLVHGDFADDAFRLATPQGGDAGHGELERSQRSAT
jgi:hypothetical protein